MSLRYYYILICFVICIVGCNQNNSSVEQPNILILMADDLTVQAINKLGNSSVITPNLDQLIKQGTLLKNAYNAGSPDEHIDQYSQQMFFSGQHFLNTKSIKKPFPKLFKSAGYDTFYTGKWIGTEAAFLSNFSEGTNLFFGNEHKIADGGHDTPIVKNLEGGILKETTTEEFSSIAFANSVIEFLWKEKRKNPFLAIAAFTSPHRPYMAPEQFTSLYDDVKINLFKNFKERHPFDNGALNVKDEMLQPTPLNKEWVKQDIRAYYAMVTELDIQIGRILNALKLTNQDKETVVVLMSDNGLALGQHGLMGKQNLYKHSTNIPLVFTGPGIKANMELETSCYIHDIYPTICDLANIDIPKSLDGISFASVFQNSNKTIRKSLLLAYGNSQRSFLAADNWKLIKYFSGKKERVQLFDLIEDPLEMNDLSKQPIFRKKLQQMSDSLIVQMARNNDSIMKLEIEVRYSKENKSPEIAIISPAPNATIHFTIDGTDPTIQSRRYYQPFKVVNVDGQKSELPHVKAAFFIGNKQIGDIAELEIAPKQPTAELISQ